MRTVEYDLNKSEYFLKINNLKFFFSSVFNKRRFESNYKYFIEEETNKLRAKYHVNIDIENFLLVAFYKKIEKRGFKILAYDTCKGSIIELDKEYIFKM